MKEIDEISKELRQNEYTESGDEITFKEPIKPDEGDCKCYYAWVRKISITESGDEITFKEPIKPDEGDYKCYHDWVRKLPITR